MENIITEFCKAWRSLNYAKMYDLCQKTWKSNHTKADLKKLIVGRIKGHVIQSSTIQSNNCIGDTELKVKINKKVKQIKVRCIKELGARKPSVDGEWGINPISLIRNLYV